MAQTTVLALGTTAATSSDIVVAADETVTVGIFAGDGLLVNPATYFQVVIDTPGAESEISLLAASPYGKPAVAISGPGTFRVRRPAYTGTPCGVFIEDGA